MSIELLTWADRIETLIANRPIGCVNRVMVIEQTTSTQDLAHSACNGQPGLIVLAGRQTQGRGRLGRPWHQGGDAGLAMTLVLDTSQHAGASLPLRIGVGIARALESLTQPGIIGLRWPNDLVARTNSVDHDAREPASRKVAGILIEQRSRLLLVGVGINVTHDAADWPKDLAGKAVSLRQLGSNASRIEIAQRVLASLDEALEQSADRILEAWHGRDVLVGTRCVFVCDGRRIEGEVLGVDPTSEIRLRLDDGSMRTLDARRTTLVHE